MTYTIILGDSEMGNVSRIDNALDGIENNLIKTRAQLDTINAEFETAKASLGSPFPQEEELQTKLKRLAELDILLNIDGNGETQEQPEQGEKPEQTEEAADKKPEMPVIGEKQESADRKPSILERIQQIKVQQNGEKRDPVPMQNKDRKSL